MKVANQRDMRVRSRQDCWGRRPLTVTHRPSLA